MANQATAYGLRPIGLVGSGVNSTGVTEYEIASDNANAIFQYGIVVPTSAGVIARAADTAGGTTAALGATLVISAPALPIMERPGSKITFIFL